MEVGLHHGRIDPHLTTGGDLVFLGHLHHPPVPFFDHLRPPWPRPVPPRPILRNLFATHPGELAIDPVGAHFPRPRFVAPIAPVLPPEHSQHDFGRRRLATTGLALLATLGQFWWEDEQ